MPAGMRLGFTALRQMARLAPNRWWRRPPFLPVPDRRYVAFRLQTQYGSGRRRPRLADVASYLRWCRVWQHLDQ